MDKVDKAVKTIKGYCDKFTHCKHGCRFYDAKANECMFQAPFPPTEWEIQGNGEH